MKDRFVRVTIDRPMGSRHPEYPNMIYPVNYGFVEGVFAPDGEEQDVYILGLSAPVMQFEGKLIAIIHRLDDIEEKWVACPVGMQFTADEIRTAVAFAEQYFESRIELLQ